MKPDKVEPVLYLLFIGILLFAGILIGVNATWPNDGQMFQVIAGILTAFSGAFFARMKPTHIDPPAAPPQGAEASTEPRKE